MLGQENIDIIYKEGKDSDDTAFLAKYRIDIDMQKPGHYIRIRYILRRV